jgi:hypothetical protein
VVVDPGLDQQRGFTWIARASSCRPLGVWNRTAARRGDTSWYRQARERLIFSLPFKVWIHSLQPDEVVLAVTLKKHRSIVRLKNVLIPNPDLSCMHDRDQQLVSVVSGNAQAHNFPRKHSLDLFAYFARPRNMPPFENDDTVLAGLYGLSIDDDDDDDDDDFGDHGDHGDHGNRISTAVPLKGVKVKV